MTYGADTQCAHCGVEITDPTTRVIHGRAAYCCPNCAAMMEQGGSGSDPKALSHDGDLRCAHCGAAIVDEATMQSRGDDAFCCANCLNTMGAHRPGGDQGGGERPAPDRAKQMR